MCSILNNDPSPHLGGGEKWYLLFLDAPQLGQKEPLTPYFNPGMDYEK